MDSNAHGVSVPRGLESVLQSRLTQGRFGRMFRNLAPYAPPDPLLATLAAAMQESPDPGSSGWTAGQPPASPSDNPDIPAGYTYLGQFIDHDITFDPVSSLDRQNDPDALIDFRTPRFDLDSMYGAGPDDDPYLYDCADSHGRATLLLSPDANDVQRNAQGRAIIGDPRNDVHIIVSQLHVAFIRFHNAVVDRVRAENLPGDVVFAEAQRRVRWHYQWLVVHDFLPKIVGTDVMSEVFPSAIQPTQSSQPGLPAQPPHVKRSFYEWRSEPYMPVEFSAAAYRFGHSMVRPSYKVNGNIGPFPIFAGNPGADFSGFRPLLPGWQVDWRLFFQIDSAQAPQPSRLMDTHLTAALFQLPTTVDQQQSLPLANLKRGVSLGLPSGQAVARAMCITPLSADQLGSQVGGADAPLWWYVLKEAEVLNAGRHLGPVGGRIVAEVLLGLLEGDALSYLNVDPCWQPTLGAAPGVFAMTDLLRVAELRP